MNVEIDCVEFERLLKDGEIALGNSRVSDGNISRVVDTVGHSISVKEVESSSAETILRLANP